VGGGELPLATAIDHVAELKKWVAELARRGGEEEGVRLNRAVELIAAAFDVKLHEVAILGLTRDGRSLRFLAPDALREVGQIPLSSGSALAAKTMREMRPEIVNHFHVVPHATVFEGVPVAEAVRADPIQKIMSSPIMMGNKPLGIVQVSRKGRSPVDAGPDFTPAQLRSLKSIADALAPCLAICAKE
jgi:GAF domain-containing protein